MTNDNPQDNPHPQLLCAWCGLVLRQGTLPASHGICPRCRDSLMNGPNSPHCAAVTREVARELWTDSQEEGQVFRQDPADWWKGADDAPAAPQRLPATPQRACVTCEWRDDCHLYNPFRAPCDYWRPRQRRLSVLAPLACCIVAWVLVLGGLYLHGCQ